MGFHIADTFTDSLAKLTGEEKKAVKTELFGKTKDTISEHIKHIFEDSELDENAVVRFFRTTATEEHIKNLLQRRASITMNISY